MAKCSNLRSWALKGYRYIRFLYSAPDKKTKVFYGVVNYRHRKDDFNKACRHHY